MNQPHPQDRQMRILNHILWSLAAVTLVNLLLTASLVGLAGSVISLVMVWGIRRGDYPLTKALGWFLLVYAVTNCTVLLMTLFSGADVHGSALIWLGLYSIILLVLGLKLNNKSLQAYLKNAPPPPEKKKKITFFRGGWRNL